MLLRARIVVPVSRPPIDDGAVAVSAGRVAWAGRWKDRPAMAGVEMQDFGESALLPGLVNAHCHLDYTGMAGLLPPLKHFTDWIKAIVALKASWTIEDFAASWRRGARMLVDTGTTTVADVEAVPELLPAAWGGTPLRVISFRELISLRSREAARELVERCVNDCLGLPGAEGRVGLSPHAPYTVTPELLEQAARAAQRRGWRLVTHVAESEEEFMMFRYGKGAMFDWLKGQRDMSDCGQGSPVQHLERCGYLDSNVLAVHANHLDRRDASLLAANGVSVVHCPRSHDYFRHLKFPRQELEMAGVNVCLGTDSLASVRKESGRAPKLSLFAEMQSLARAAPELAPETILRMATMSGARALGRAGAIGEISRGAAADLIVLPISGASSDVFEAVIHHTGKVAASMIGGEWAVGPAEES
jgi:cytosine/adenosine deaminase-related metal-dependent hydrolase